ncbi:major facilitator superfamily domain-containing protein [Exophiala viscosa]|uniref:Major facilitator superfamily domain-containing protein n=1 Tax=Exophiala viscosa TaxID=2486360 RepID=A0AAN6DU46_9EURO|nr:major facilitator superfamily domain-containing protein [Exophiala viscosa]KAI1623921.1 major facilitator superfamily domain-containing protein [Exophiala viscosa]
MGFGILEPKRRMDHVPGTTFLDDHDVPSIVNATHLKKGTGRNSHIVLIPQPSNDPNDPLNWPLWQRDGILLLTSSCTLIVIGGFGPILSPIAIPLIEEFKINFTQYGLLSGYCLCATGAIGIFIASFCRKFGKRPGLIFSMACAFAGSLWAGAARSYGSFLGARVVQGFACSFFESVMYAIIGDLYFVHERGLRMAVFVTSLSGISNIPVLVSGKVAANLGWRWIFWLLSIFVGILFLLCLLFGWETAYNRNPLYEIDQSSQDNLQILEQVEASKAEHQEVENNGNTMSRTRTGDDSIMRRESIWHRMLPFHGTYSETSLLKLLIRPFLIIINPAVIWAGITLVFPVLWVVGISVVLAEILAGPPYNLGTTDIGYLSAGPVVVGILANLFCGLVSDPLAKWMSRRNGGIYEPEFRLFLILGLAIFATIGYFCFGNLITQGTSVVCIAIIYGIIVGSGQFAAVTVGAYMVDAYRDISIEVFIITMIVKNFMFYGFTYFVSDWVVAWGPAKMFNVIGGIQLALCTLTIPLYFYGKRLRAWWHAHPAFSKL